uniref:RagB/SusD family nutrient uptake outer membrane protein n=1 Tax=Roseihalotalea indica TaxID=2867963 RepID=A0AA49GLV3_9BACT|nr:RagB/SusD family nutrient uptake outer membrane protein [Tunicatimonas sp. TK19036]
MKNTTYISIITGLLLLLGSCDDALEKLPLDAPSDETFFSNQAELQLGINGVYRSLYWRSGSLPYPMVMDNATDLGFLRTDFSGMQTYSRGAHSSVTSGFSETWQEMYSGIGRANNLLNNMDRAQDEVSEAFYQQVKAEAKFMRAYFYSWLIQLYGDVPYITELQSLENADVPRTPKAEIITNLFTDLDEAASILPDSWGGSDEGRATKGAALALKARIALMNEQYDVAAQAAQEVIDLGVYSLYPDYAELFTYAGQRSAEVILDMPFLVGFVNTSVPQEQGPRNSSCWSRLVPSQFVIDSYECTDGLPIDESPLYNPATPFENRDPRLDASIIRPQSLFATYVFETHPDSIETWQIIDGNAKRVANQDVLNPFASFTGYLWRKYTSETDLPNNRSNSELNFILMRYAEVLLTYAEAKIELGQIDGSVLEAMNAVRARAYGVNASATAEYPAITTTDQDALRRLIRRERKVELADEGFRMLDIHRWGIAEHVMPGTLLGRPKGAYADLSIVPEIDEYGHPQYGSAEDQFRSVDQRVFEPGKDYLWPIPQKDIDVNDQLEQNPAY